MVNRLACELDGVTAVAAVSGPLINGTAAYGTPFECTRRVPILHIHGTHDPIIPFGGCNATYSSYGEDCTLLHKIHNFASFPDVPTYIQEWARRNSATGAAATFNNGTVSCTAYGSDPLSNVTLCIAAGEGHAWPGNSELCDVAAFHCTLDMDATGEILRFFRSVNLATEAVVQSQLV